MLFPRSLEESETRLGIFARYKVKVREGGLEVLARSPQGPYTTPGTGGILPLTYPSEEQWFGSIYVVIRPASRSISTPMAVIS